MNFFERYFLLRKRSIKMQVTFSSPNQNWLRQERKNKSQNYIRLIFFKDICFLKQFYKMQFFLFHTKCNLFANGKCFVFFKRTFQNMENNGGYFECSFI
jgi:hypothetical protein